MADIKELAGILKPKDSKYVLEGQNFKIGKGVLTCEDNEIIPLESISFVEILEQGKKGYGRWPLALLAGIGLTIIPQPTIRIIGIIVLIIAVLNIVLIFLKNRQTVYVLRIQNHAGRFFYIEDTDLNFIKEIRAALQKCFEDKDMYYEKSRGVNIVNHYEGDHVMGDKNTAGRDINTGNAGNSGTIVTDSNIVSGNHNVTGFGSGDVMAGGSTKYSSGGDMVFGPNVKGDYVDRGSVKNVNTNMLTTDEWELFGEFVLRRRNDFQQGERNYIICNNFAVYAREKDEEKCESLLHKAGSKAVELIFATASKAVKDIVAKFQKN
ncbi:MAG: hypothetical protein K2P73_14245 [Lachnospiraceae bacterium]|nr:hypothetical protein [Lachnospiraceae bacterium]